MLRIQQKLNSEAQIPVDFTAILKQVHFVDTLWGTFEILQRVRHPKQLQTSQEPISCPGQ